MTKPVDDRPCRHCDGPSSAHFEPDREWPDGVCMCSMPDGPCGCPGYEPAIPLKKRHFEDAQGVCMWCEPGSSHGAADDCPPARRLAQAIDAFVGATEEFGRSATAAAEAVARLREALESDPRFEVRVTPEGRLVASLTEDAVSEVDDLENRVGQEKAQ